MKKKLLLVLGLACMLGTSGCRNVFLNGESISCPAATDEPATAANIAENTMGTSVENLIITEPPTLSVIHGETTLEALQGSSSWTAQNADGTFTNSEIRCGHPLKAKQSMPSLSLTPSYLSHVEPFAAYLHFGVAPDSVEVICWSEAYWGQPAANDKGESIPVTTIETPQTDTTASIQYQFELKEGNYIYLISAKWNNSELYKGSADYSFYTVNPLLEPMPIDTSAGSGKTASPYVLSESYDFNHNGVAEVLTLTSGDADTIEDATTWTMTITENGQELLNYTAGLAHVGWGSMFATKIEGKDYILYYTPYMNQGYATYTYYIFSLDGQNAKVLKQKKSVSFDINIGSPLHESFDPAAIAAFMQDVDSWLAKSTLLFSTEGGIFQSGGSGADFKEDEGWLESGYDSSKSLVENLKLFQERHTSN